MTRPYSETVISAMETALRAINRQAGYNSDVNDVRRWSRFGDEREGVRGAIELLVGSQDFRSEGSEFFVSLTVSAVCYLEPAEDQLAFSTDELVNLLAHDVTTAIAKMDFQALGVHLSAFEVVPFSIEDPTEPHDGCTVETRFEYTVDQEDQQILLSPLST